MTTFLRLYRRNPKSGEDSSNCAMAFRISTMPPLPRPNSSTSSRATYLRRNLRIRSAFLDTACAPRLRIEAYHPPGSATAVSWASLIFTSSKPFSDMALPSYSKLIDQVVVFRYSLLSSLRTFCVAFRGSSGSRTLIRQLSLACPPQTLSIVKTRFTKDSESPRSCTVSKTCQKLGIYWQ